MLSQTAEYALRAVLYIARNTDGEPMKLARIAEALGVPKNYLSKTLHQLARNGILLSGRGPVGGFILARPAESLTLADVVEPFDAARLARHCLLGEGPCSDETACAAHALWKTIAEPMRAFFRTTTIADLVRQDTGDDAAPFELPGTRPANAPPASPVPVPARAIV